MRQFYATAAILLLTSCYYESSHPLGALHEAELDGNLIGSWRVVDEEDEADKIRVRAFDERSYVVEIDSDGDHEVFRAFVTEISGARFLNVQPLDGASRRYMFFRYHWAADTLVLRGIREHAPPPLAGQATLRRWIAQHMDAPAIYDETGRLTRE